MVDAVGRREALRRAPRPGRPTLAAQTNQRGGGRSSAALALELVRLARPKHWIKSGFVLIGPFYGMAVEPGGLAAAALPVALAATAFALAASGCYAVNDVLDAPLDRVHPRKRNRPVAAGKVSPTAAMLFALALFALAGGAVALTPGAEARLWLGLSVAGYVALVGLYSAGLKRVVIADVMCLSLGFVLRVLGGCAAAAVTPSAWLLNCTLFLAMFMAFGKRLGERRTLGDEASAARRVQGLYTDDLLRMVVVVTGVATLVSYSFYVEDQSDRYTFGFNLLWLTVLPATYVLLRCIVLLEQGRYDDPTELAVHDGGFQIGSSLFALVTAALLLLTPHSG